MPLPSIDTTTTRPLTRPAARNVWIPLPQRDFSDYKQAFSDNHYPSLRSDSPYLLLLTCSASRLHAWLADSQARPGLDIKYLSIPRVTLHSVISLGFFGTFPPPF